MNASATAALTPLPDGVWSTLSAARAAYHAAVPAAYDEVLTEVAERARDTGSLGKTDIAALVVWKRLQASTAWVVELMNLRDAEVRTVTAEAVHAVRDQDAPRGAAARQGRKALLGLPGCRHGDALASALLTAAAPDRMAVYDRRAQFGLERLGYQRRRRPAVTAATWTSSTTSSSAPAPTRPAGPPATWTRPCTGSAVRPRPPGTPRRSRGTGGASPASVGPSRHRRCPALRCTG